MRISDWSSDVCSSDLVKLVVAIVPAKARVYPEHLRGRKPPQLHEDLYARAEAVLKRDGIAHADLLATGGYDWKSEYVRAFDALPEAGSMAPPTESGDHIEIGRAHV